MMNSLSLVLFFAVTCIAVVVGGGPSADQNPLDLPSGGAGGDEDDEDAPETIVFYGYAYEGDAFCWSLDRSGSMMWDGRWPVLQEELASAVGQLSSLADFGILFWSDGSPLAWQHRSARATPMNKAAALAWAAGITPNGGTCVIEGMLRSLELNRTSTRREKVILLLSDGEPYCNFESNAEEAIQTISAANWDNQRINTIGVNVGSSGAAFLIDLAASNGGEFNPAG